MQTSHSSHQPARYEGEERRYDTRRLDSIAAYPDNGWGLFVQPAVAEERRQSIGRRSSDLYCPVAELPYLLRK